MAECFPNMRKDLDIQIHETNRSPPNLNPRQSFTGNIIIKRYTKGINLQYI